VKLVLKYIFFKMLIIPLITIHLRKYFGIWKGLKRYFIKLLEKLSIFVGIAIKK
jgi:hypothetical protein